MDKPFPTLSTEFLSPMHEADMAVLSGFASVDLSVATPADTPVPMIVSATVSKELSGLREALALALETAPQVIDNLVGRALLGMDRQATAHPDAVQRSLLDAAAAAMDAHRKPWSKQFAVLLRVAFAHPPAANAQLPAVDLRVCSHEMNQLEALVLAAGSQRGNPLAPTSYVRALVELISRSQVNPELRPVWAHFLLGALGTQLAWVYLQMAASVRSPGIRDAGSRGVLQSEEQEFGDYADYVYGLGGKAPPDLPQQATARQVLTPEMRALAMDARRMVKQLRSVLGRSAPMPLNEGGDSIEQMMQDIEESEQLMIEVSERGLPMPTLETPAEEQSRRARQVERLIEEYRSASTPSLARVPMPLRSALDILQQPLEQLAAVDENMLTQPDHAVRLFLDGITQRSFLFASEASDGFASFFNPVQKILEAVSQVAQPSAKVYVQALERLQPIWTQQDVELKKLEEQKERSLAQLGERKQLASRLAFELVGRRDAGDAPVAVKQFLMGPWAQVLARAKLHAQHPQDEQRYDYITALLLWSVSTRRAGAHKAQLMQLAPQLAEGLRAGLASVEYPQANTDAVLQELKKLQDAVMLAGTDDGSEDTRPPTPAR